MRARVAGDYPLVGSAALRVSPLEVRLDRDQVRELAALVADHLREPDDDRWFKTRAAAAYLGITPTRCVRWQPSARSDSEQEAPGHMLNFKRSCLDAYRSGAPA